jgi:hypothetical protein
LRIRSAGSTRSSTSRCRSTVGPTCVETFPEEFENRVLPSIVPTDWVKLRVVVEGSTVRISVGSVNEVTLEVRKLGQLDGGQVGLFVGNVSGGDFANLVITPSK